MILRKISYKNLIDSNFQKLSLLLQFSARSWKPCRNVLLPSILGIDEGRMYLNGTMAAGSDPERDVIL